jgi:hypothetical protein
MAKINFFGYLDISFLPVNCVYRTNFHGRLLLVCVVPFTFVAAVVLGYLLVRIRLHYKIGELLESERLTTVRKLQAKCTYVVIIFLFTVFPLVSTTIFQNFKYDSRLGGDQSYLEADYSISRSDEIHQDYVVFAVAMALLYCLGIPAISYLAMRSNLSSIQRLQDVESELVALEG